MKQELIEKLEKGMENILDEIECSDTASEEGQQEIKQLTSLLKTYNDIMNRSIELDQKSDEIKFKHEEKMLELDNIRIKNDDEILLEKKKVENSLYIEGRKIDSNEMIQNEVNSIKKDELCQEKKKFLNDNIGNYLKIGVQAAGIIIPTIFYGNWIREGLEFEKTGTFTSKTFTGLLSKIKPN